MGHLIGYIRLSAVDEEPDLQVSAVAGAGCDEVFTDRSTGPVDPRPELEKLLDALRPGDTLVIWRLDRPGRSLRHVLKLVDDLRVRGVGLRVLANGIDTSAPGNAYCVFEALSSFEHDLIRERTSARLAAARTSGKTGGRPALLTEEQTARARELYARGEKTVAEIGEVFGVSRTTVYRALEQDGELSVPPRRPHRRASQD